MKFLVIKGRFIGRLNILDNTMIPNHGPKIVETFYVPENSIFRIDETNRRVILKPNDGLDIYELTKEDFYDLVKRIELI